MQSNDSRCKRVVDLVRVAVPIFILIAIAIWFGFLKIVIPGGDVPNSRPVEDNRVYHPFGFSIIAPKRLAR